MYRLIYNLILKIILDLRNYFYYVKMFMIEFNKVYFIV